ncbi:MAG: tRNA (guanosine(46)-N7)-methyltransferase TrmB [Lachnospiraceae bacterium]|nr:tRNA (guanosine(46)-N7)-methyltransferase TrmB [Lachnospiraceae bacterium]
MRLRNVKGSRETIANSTFTIDNPEDYKGKFKELFGNDNPIQIEVGMGKGRFITDLATLNPDINYIGIEKYSSVLVRAIEKRELLDINNLFFIRMDAEDLEKVFEKGEVDKIYLNFSDPWPKDRHAKRRLTSRQFFGRYDTILKQGGIVEFKTDNTDLFNFSLEEIPFSAFKVTHYTYDLHNDETMNQGNIMTEYEEKFSSMGNPIHKLIAERKN